MRIELLNNLSAMFSDMAEELKKEARLCGGLTSETCNKLLDIFATGKTPVAIMTGSETISRDAIWFQLIKYCLEMQYCE